MLINNYYTPSIEEFHVGFEFELQQLDEGGHYTNEYAETTIDDSYDFNNIWDIFNCKRETQIRVKYLDEEDIVSLGFQNISYSQSLGSHYILDNCRIWVNGGLIYIYKGIYNVFQGIILNKSELKKLLKQLTII